MELNRKLVMTFKTTDDKKVSLTVDNPKEDLTEEEVKTAMELIKDKNIFTAFLLTCLLPYLPLLWYCIQKRKNVPESDWDLC